MQPHVSSLAATLLAVWGLASTWDIPRWQALCLGLVLQGGLIVISARYGDPIASALEALYSRLQKQPRRTARARPAKNRAAPIRKYAIPSIVAGGLLAVAVSVLAQQGDPVSVTHPSGLDASIGIANVTAGDEQYSPSVSVRVDEVVKVQVSVANPTGDAVRGAHLSLLFDHRDESGQEIAAVLGHGDEDVRVATRAELSIDSAELRPLLGSLALRAPTTGGDGTYETTGLPDGVLFDLPYELGDIAAGEGMTLTVLMRSFATELAVNVEVRQYPDGPWKTEIAAAPGGTVEYRVLVGNRGNEPLRDGVVSFNLPAGLAYVPDSTVVGSADDVRPAPDGVVDFSSPTKSRGGGLDVEEIRVGGELDVRFRAKLAGDLGVNVRLVGVGVFRAAGTNEFYNTAWISTP